MNTAAAIEIAVAAVLRQFATLGEGVVVRPSQSLNSDPTWKKSKDRTYPMVSVQCSTPDPEDGNPAVMEASCRVVCGTWNDDDKDHNKVREMFDGAKFVITINSTAINEALMAGVPVLAFGPHLSLINGAAKKASTATLKQDIQAMLDGWMPCQHKVINYLAWIAGEQVSISGSADEIKSRLGIGRQQ